MSNNTPSADVCTPKRPRRTAAPKLPYPDVPANATGSDFWLVHVQRDKAKLAAFRKHAGSVWTRSKNGPLSDALATCIRLLEEELVQHQGFLDDALETEQRGVPA